MGERVETDIKIEFDKNGKPSYISGSNDDTEAILENLNFAILRWQT